jgi:hypothetical protein
MQHLERHLDRRRRRREQKNTNFWGLFEEYRKSGGGYSPKTKASKENSKSTASMAREEAWRAFLFELQTSNTSFVCVW